MLVVFGLGEGEGDFPISGFLRLDHVPSSVADITKGSHSRGSIDNVGKFVVRTRVAILWYLPDQGVVLQSKDNASVCRRNFNSILYAYPPLLLLCHPISYYDNSIRK
jgi:hypothetical protein